MPTLYLIDGNAYMHRAFHALPPLTNSRGLMVNAIYGFTRMLMKLMGEKKPEYLAVCFDHPSKTFRHEAYPAYKATRKKIDEGLKEQMPRARDLARALGLAVIEKQGFEADDLIATMAKNAEKEHVSVVIVTGDKDAFQLVNKNIKVWNEQKNMLFDENKVEEKYGLKPGNLIDMFALMGDSSDNVPGVKGIGEKTAVKLLQRFGSLKGILENIEAIEGKAKELILKYKDDALESKSLVTLRADVPIELRWQDCKLNTLDKKKAVEFFKEMEFNSLIKEFSAPDTDAPTPASLSASPTIQTHIIFTAEDLTSFVAKARSSSRISFDLETDSVDALRAHIVGFSFALNESEGYYIPVGHNYLGAATQLSLQQVIESVKPFMIDPTIKKYGQNIKYDLLILRRHSLPVVGIYFDTMVASYCINPSKNTHNLKDMALEYLQYPMTRIEELIGAGSKQITMDKVEIEKAAPYASADAVIVNRLAKVLGAELKQKNLESLFFNVEMPLVEILCAMEEAGIQVDVPYLKELSKDFAEGILALEKSIIALAGQEFNPNSPKQLAVILFEKLQLPAVKKTKTGYSTNEEVLQGLSLRHPLPAKVLEYRELQKLKSTYIDALVELVNPDTGRVHTSLNQAVTSTGRLSSSNPNLQNIPVRSEYGRKIRSAFIARKGHVLLSADYSQIDLRSLAHVSQDEVLIASFKQGEDVHSITAREVFGETNDELRRIAKTINFGIIYGQSPYGLAQQLGIPNNKAREYIENYFKKYRGVRAWMDAVIKEARKNGYVQTLLGRIRYIPEINSPNLQLRSFAERTALNTPIQGTSADIIKVAMIALVKEFKRLSWGLAMLVQVHDELLFEIPHNDLSQVSPVIKSIMEKTVTLTIPVVVDLKAGKNWRDMEKIT